MSAWMEVLDRIEQSLRQSLSVVVEPAPAPRREEPGPREALDRLDARMRQWQASLDEARRNAAGADEALAAEHASLLDCRERLGVAIEALARWCEAHPSPKR
jgi:hypothetical protein